MPKGVPSKGTPKDKRLKENKNKPRKKESGRKVK